MSENGQMWGVEGGGKNKNKKTKNKFHL